MRTNPYNGKDMPAEASALRYRVSLMTPTKRSFSYSVATHMGAYKAVAIAVEAHMVAAPNERVYKLSVTELPGDKRDGADLYDRFEW
ncbi:MAG: hypothetical protein HUJ28_10565 [Chromatiales bacterium]|nr:hypothetical protein [Chromatiales bacterium]